MEIFREILKFLNFYLSFHLIKFYILGIKTRKFNLNVFKNLTNRTNEIKNAYISVIYLLSNLNV